MYSPTVKKVRRMGWTMILASLLGGAALLLAPGCVEDDQQRHLEQTCQRVVYSACLESRRCDYEGCIKCALIGATDKGAFLRADAASMYPIIEGDTYCAKWKEVQP